MELSYRSSILFVKPAWQPAKCNMLKQRFVALMSCNYHHRSLSPSIILQLQRTTRLFNILRKQQQQHHCAAATSNNDAKMQKLRRQKCEKRLQSGSSTHDSCSIVNVTTSFDDFWRFHNSNGWYRLGIRTVRKVRVPFASSSIWPWERFHEKLTVSLDPGRCFKFAAFFTLVIIIVIHLAIGILPHVDNFAHIGGFLTGFLLGFVFLIRPQFGWVNQLYARVDYSPTRAKPKFKKY
ncbi:hypothetical protein RYX36_021278 [Vicia faba]